MSRIAMWWQHYRDQGLPGKLVIYAALSYGLAAITFSIPYSGVSEMIWFALTACFAVAWLVVVLRGTFQCGWPSVILWPPIYWALYWPAIATMIVVGCYVGSCI